MAHSLKPKPWSSADIKVWYSDGKDAPLEQLYAVGTEMQLTFKVRLGNGEEPNAEDFFEGFRVEPPLPQNLYFDSDTGGITGATATSYPVQRYTVTALSPLWLKTAEVTMGFGCLPTRPKQPTIKRGRFRGEIVVNFEHCSADMRHQPHEEAFEVKSTLPIEHYAIFLRDCTNGTAGSPWLSIDTHGKGIAQHPSIRCPIKVEDVMDATCPVPVNCSIRIRGLTPRKVYQARLERRNLLGWSPPSRPKTEFEHYPQCEVPADTF
eukprot:gnl/MRDRNA2_/MRDRNA2_96374_c0_seq1.p1 gnl/MRDRNA2_/MRDRNA2_96374_c0~~gnl/MRDRNA2_/MRDRNA2_96374_c0_seq1.p1  ORF type:complete len:264 (-),score=44.33 gnl/MRDRNA2_/MRDRNA2_96374_c0_seq1:132-923(-)